MVYCFTVWTRNSVYTRYHQK